MAPARATGGMLRSRPWMRSVAAVALALAPTCLVPAPARSGAFELSPRDPRLEGRPDLRERLLGSAHGYFRFFAAPFAQRVCEQLRDLGKDLSEVNLHGDAHVEQYAVTSLGRGLTDFDEATRGPYALDLVRFGVSLQLAAAERGWGKEAGKSLDALFKGYREGLGKPGSPIRTPRVVTRIRETFHYDHAELLRRADAILDETPVPPESLDPHYQAYVEQRLHEWSGMPASFFRLKRAGRLRLGIGSALDEKYLVRVEGWTDAPDDDVVLEAKEVRDLAGVSCTRRDMGPDRILTANELIAYEPFPFSGLMEKEGKVLWVHAWPDDYEELGIPTSFREAEELREVAFDVGVQLGRAHPKPESGPTRDEDRRAVRAAARRHERRLRYAIRELTGETEEAWRAFRAAAVEAGVPEAR